MTAAPAGAGRANFTGLTDSLPVFDADIPAFSELPSKLKEYLDFYQLPLPGNELQLYCGKFFFRDQQLFAIAWQPPQPTGTALVVHGYMDHVGLFGHLFRHLIERGLTVMSYDLPGHGLSWGERAYIHSFDEYESSLRQMIDLASAKFPGRLHGIGQSTGGAILLKHLIDHGRSDTFRFATLNVLAPLLHPHLWRVSRIGYVAARRFRDSISRKYRDLTTYPGFQQFLREGDPLQPRRIPFAWIGAMAAWVRELKQSDGSDYPVNLIQGDQDRTLDWKYNLKVFRKKFPRMSVHMIPGAGHHLVNQNETLRRQVMDALQL